jgi:uracil-DNA glycosylase
MNVSDSVICLDFPCTDINRQAYTMPSVNIDPQKIRIFMVSEAPPPDKDDYFYSGDNSFYLQTTLKAFHDADMPVSGIKEILDRGIYITTAVKCGKRDYSISTDTVRNCSVLLEKEMVLFPNIEVFLLMGDVAIKSMNYIWKKQTGNVVIPAGSTYKLRKRPYYFDGKRVFPSYLQTGKNYLIEKSKRKTIAEDIRAAMDLIR